MNWGYMIDWEYYKEQYDRIYDYNPPCNSKEDMMNLEITTVGRHSGCWEDIEDWGIEEKAGKFWLVIRGGDYIKYIDYDMITDLLVTKGELKELAYL